MGIIIHQYFRTSGWYAEFFSPSEPPAIDLEKLHPCLELHLKALFWGNTYSHTTFKQ